MDYDVIRGCLTACRFTDHARREMAAEPLGPIGFEDEPYPSYLILGRTETGRPLHLVCAPVIAEQRLIVITVYEPDLRRWIQGFRQWRTP